MERGWVRFLRRAGGARKGSCIVGCLAGRFRLRLEIDEEVGEIRC